MPPVWVVPSAILIGIFASIYIHVKLSTKKIEQDFSKIIIMEIVPAFSFSITFVYLLMPSFYYLLTAEQISWATGDIFWRLATFIGASVFTISLIGWVDLFEEETESELPSEMDDEEASVTQELEEERDIA